MHMISKITHLGMLTILLAATTKIFLDGCVDLLPLFGFCRERVTVQFHNLEFGRLLPIQ